jgi:hypothetical protein
MAALVASVGALVEVWVRVSVGALVVVGLVGMATVLAPLSLR